MNDNPYEEGMPSPYIKINAMKSYSSWEINGTQHFQASWN